MDDNLQEKIKYDGDYSDTSFNNDLFKLYMNEVCRYPILTADEERNLLYLIQNGAKAKEMLNDDDITLYKADTLKDLIDKGNKAKEKLINCNLRLVVSVAKKYRGYNISLTGLVQEGNMGLMKAADMFNADMDNRFSTYAIWWIRQFILRYIANTGRAIRLPVHIIDTINKYKHAQSELLNKLERSPTDEEIAKYIGMPVNKLKDIIHCNYEMMSLDVNVGTSTNDDDTTAFGDLIKDNNAISPEEYSVLLDMSERVSEALSVLSEKEQEIIKLRFGIDTPFPLSLSEISVIYGISKERVRQIECRAIRKLRFTPTKKKLKEFAFY